MFISNFGAGFAPAPSLGRLIARANWIFFWYYAGSTISYIALIILAFLYRKRHTENTVVRNLALSHLLMPRVTVIAPAKNEEACILGAARAFLELDYLRIATEIAKQQFPVKRRDALLRMTRCRHSGPGPVDG